MKKLFAGLLFCLLASIAVAAPIDSYSDPTGAFHVLQPSNSLFVPNGISLTSRTAPGAGSLSATNIAASGTLSGTAFSTYLASPPAIGGTAAAAGSFTTLSASSTVSGTGFSTYLASPPAIGGTAAAAGSFTTLSASSTVSGTGFSTYLASPPAIGGTAAAAGSFTTLNATQGIFSAASGGTYFCGGLTGNGCTTPFVQMTLNGTGGTTLNIQSRPAGNGMLLSFGSTGTDEGAVLLAKGQGALIFQNTSSVADNSKPTIAINNNDNTSGATTSISIRHGGRDIGFLNCVSEDTSTLTGNCSFFAFNASTATRAWRADKSGNMAIKATIGVPQATLDVQGGQFLVRGGTAPTISACGTSPVAPSGADSSFFFTAGTGALTSCVINFGTTWLTAPKTCHLTPMNATAALQQTTGAYVSAISTTQLTITGLNLTSTKYGVTCQ